MKVTAKDLRFHSKEILEATSRGEEVTITYRGKPMAKIIPLESENRKKEKHHEFFGIWKDYDATSDVEKYVRKLRMGRF